MISGEPSKRYETTDLPFYRRHVAPLLPERVLDFHAHTWTREQWQLVPWNEGKCGANYMVTTPDYGIGQLRADLAMLFPDRPIDAVCFGYPTPAANLGQTNDYLAGAAAHPGLLPLLITGRGSFSKEQLRQAIRRRGFFGYKVLLSWHGNDYGNVTVEDMIGPDEMEVANELSLVVLLHVPRAGRLVDPVVQEGVRRLSASCPRASIVLAHCGRCYLPDEMDSAIGSVRDLANVYLDTSMVMDPTVLQIAMENIGPSRLLFATDLPVAAMRGRRVYVMDHWVDVVAEGYPKSGYRVASDEIRATFMAWEIVMAIHRASERIGLGEAQRKAVFLDNGLALLEKVLDGRQLAKARRR